MSGLTEAFILTIYADGIVGCVTLVPTISRIATEVHRVMGEREIDRVEVDHWQRHPSAVVSFNDNFWRKREHFTWRDGHVG